MNHTIDTPFTIGQQFWAPVTYPEKITLPCPVCFGSLVVTVVLGNDERIGVPCEACGKGFGGPQGTIEEYEHAPGAKPFVIAAVKSLWDHRWTVESEDGQSRNFDELCATEAEALAVSVKRMAEQHERNMQSRQHRRKNTKEATWSIRYHREQIKDLERQIAWHQSRITTHVPR